MINKKAIFISYRHSDIPWAMQAVSGRLIAHFGKKLFMDVEDIKEGQDFIEVIDKALKQCGAFLALIGDNWLVDNRGRQRLEDPDDIVRREIVIALKHNLLIVPILVDSVEMPSENDLPPDIKAIHRFNACRLRYTDFRRDIETLIGILERELNLPRASVPWLDMPQQKQRDIDPIASAQWLRYWHHHADFVSREEEMHDLHQFFNIDKHFTWYAITGPGGVGKSRLALESLFALEKDWHKGFLKEEDRKTVDWRHWKPQLSTAIVVDYAAQDPDWLVDWLNILCRAQFEWPVRVLLIERDSHVKKEEKQYWWKKLTTGRMSALDRVDAFYKIDRQREPQPLKLSPLDKRAQRHLLLSFLQAAKKEADMPSEDDMEVWQMLDQLTEQGRPLFIGMVAAALATEGIINIRNWHHDDLLEHTLAREREIWNDVIHQNSTEKIARHAVRLIAIATGCGGFYISNDEIARHVKACLDTAHVLDQDVSTGDLYRMAALMTNEESYALEPDLLGEYFLLTQQWKIPSTEEIDEISQLRADILCSWDINPLACASTIVRTIADFHNESTSTMQWLSFLTEERGERVFDGTVLILVALDAVYVFGIFQNSDGLKQVFKCIEALVENHRDKSEIQVLGGGGVL